jgi:hypothetical protein
MLPFDISLANIMLVFAAFFAAGTSKGVLGVGIPLIAVPALSGVMHPATTVSVLALPIFLSNVWQSVEQRRFRNTVRRFWPALPMVAIGSVIGAQFITTIDAVTAHLVLGVIVTTYALSQLAHVSVPAPSAQTEKPWTAAAGLVSGFLGGLAAYFGPPWIMYLVALRVNKDDFIAAAAMLYMVGITPLCAVLIIKGVLGGPELILSAFGTAVIFAALLFGRWLRDRISQEVFRKALLLVLVVMGANMIRRGLM